MLAGVWYCLCMVAKKKPSSRDSGSAPATRKVAQRKAQKAVDQYLEAPTNRSQVINPMGYVQDGDGWFMKTKGRFRAADKVGDRAYRASMPPTRGSKKK